MSISSFAVSSEVMVTGLDQCPPLAGLVSFNCIVSRPRSWNVWLRPLTAPRSQSSFTSAQDAAFEDQVSESSMYCRIVLVVAPPHNELIVDGS